MGYPYRDNEYSDSRRIGVGEAGGGGGVGGGGGGGRRNSLSRRPSWLPTLSSRSAPASASTTRSRTHSREPSAPPPPPPPPPPPLPPTAAAILQQGRPGMRNVSFGNNQTIQVPKWSGRK